MKVNFMHKITELNFEKQIQKHLLSLKDHSKFYLSGILIRLSYLFHILITIQG